MTALCVHRCGRHIQNMEKCWFCKRKARFFVAGIRVFEEYKFFEDFIVFLIFFEYPNTRSQNEQISLEICRFLCIFMFFVVLPCAAPRSAIWLYCASTGALAMVRICKNVGFVKGKHGFSLRVFRYSRKIRFLKISLFFYYSPNTRIPGVGMSRFPWKYVGFHVFWCFLWCCFARPQDPLSDRIVRPPVRSPRSEYEKMLVLYRKSMVFRCGYSGILGI